MSVSTYTPQRSVAVVPAIPGATTTVVAELRGHKRSIGKLSQGLGGVAQVASTPTMSMSPHHGCPVSFSQEARLAFQEIAALKGTAFPRPDFPVGIRLRGHLCVNALKRAVEDVTGRHAALRTRFEQRNTSTTSARLSQLMRTMQTGVLSSPLFQQSVTPEVSVPLVHVQVRGTAQILGSSLLEAAEECVRCFQNSDGDQHVSVRVFSRGKKEHLAIIIVSHLVADGWSARRIQQEVIRSYIARVDGQILEWPTVSVHSQDVAARERRRVQAGECDYDIGYWWTWWSANAHAMVQYADLPCARRPPRAIIAIRMSRTPLTADASSKIRALTKRLRVTPYVFFRTALSVLLCGYTHKNRVALWTNLSNRQYALENTVGWVATRHAILCDIGADPTIEQLMLQQSAAIRTARQYQATPLAAVWSVMRRNLSLVQGAQIGLDMAGPHLVVEKRGIATVTVRGGREWMDLDFRIRDDGDLFTITTTCNEARYYLEGVQMMLSDLCRLMTLLTKHSHYRVSAILRAGAIR